MDHLVPWIVVAVILFGWLRRGARGVGRIAAAVREGAAETAIQARAAAQVRAAQPPAAAPRPPSPAPSQARSTSPQRRPPQAAPGRTGAAPGTIGALVGEQPVPGDAGQAVAQVLRHGPSLRTAIVVAELLAPPVALR